MVKISFKKILLILLATLFIANTSFVFATNEAPSLYSQSAILIDSKTGKVLYSKNADKKMYPASTTKILTAILTLENCNLDEKVTVSHDAIASIPDGYSSASLQFGEELTIEQLLQLLIIHSANDAANVLAEHVGGSIESFVSMMNTKVYELGLSNTHFTNAFGMHNDNHYTTAQDLAIIMNYCIKNEDFRRISGKASCAIPATNKYDARSYTSTNALIIPNSYMYYTYLTCGKTGYTSQAGDCLVSCSYKDDLELICVVLGGKVIDGVSTRFSETKTLFEYGYENYSFRTLLEKNDVVNNLEVKNASNDTKNLDLIASDPIYALLENSLTQNDFVFEVNLNDNIKAPIEEGEILGSVSCTIDGIKYETNLMASHFVEKSKLFYYVFGFGVLVIIIALICFASSKKKNKYC